MRYDPTDYVRATKEQVRDLIAAAFPSASVYLADRETIPSYKPAGTFCLEATTSRVDASAEIAAVIVGLRIWTYVEAVAGEDAEQLLTALAQKLEAVLMAATRGGPNAQADWLAAETLQTTYVPAEKGRARRRPYLRAAHTDWEVRLAATR